MAASDSLGAFPKFVSPTVANGKVFVPTFSGNVVVYGLLPVAPSATNSLTTVLPAQLVNSPGSGAVTPGEMVNIFGVSSGSDALPCKLPAPKSPQGVEKINLLAKRENVPAKRLRSLTVAAPIRILIRSRDRQGSELPLQ